MNALQHREAPGRQRRPLLLVGVLVTVGLLVVILANAHLVYVAVTSQPDCVAHIQASETPAPKGSFSAAKSACTP
jgi:hypothetical protein